MELCISFDDTGSMSSVRREVRTKVNSLVSTLFDVVPNLRVGIIIHNDYCDRDTIQKLELTSDKDKIISFVERGSSCGGGDSDECYELVIQEFTKFDWQSSDRVCLLIGDCCPHGVGYKHNGISYYVDWHKETSTCKDMGIKIYTIQALGNKFADYFYKQVADMTGGVRLELSQFAHITQYITAITFNQAGRLEEYESSNETFKTNIALRNMFNKLKGKLDEVVSSEKIATLAKFQVMDVPTRTRITDFVVKHGLSYKKGKGYYELIKPEIVQEDKEVLMVHKKTGETIESTIECRRMLGLPYGTRGRLNPSKMVICRDYDVYIQSNSFTRQLDPGTKFLYELDKR